MFKELQEELSIINEQLREILKHTSVGIEYGCGLELVEILGGNAYTVSFSGCFPGGTPFKRTLFTWDIADISKREFSLKIKAWLFDVLDAIIIVGGK